METISDTLVEIGIAIEKQSGEFGAAPKARGEYIRDAIRRLREILCPHTSELLKRLKEPRFDLAATILDLVLRHYSVPGLANLTKKLAEIGMGTFCADPEGTLGKAADG